MSQDKLSATVPVIIPSTVKAARKRARELRWSKIPEGDVVAVQAWMTGLGVQAIATGGPSPGGDDVFRVTVVGPWANKVQGQALVDRVARAGLAMGYRVVEVPWSPFASADLLRRAGWVREDLLHDLVRYTRRAEGRRGEIFPVPLGQAEANAVVDRLHSHHGASRGSMWSVGIADRGGEIHCVAQVGVVRARMLMSATTAEVVRVASDGTKNVASMALARCTAALFALGYTRVVSYTILGESGHSYRVAGWWPTSLSAGGQWSRPSRARAAAQQALPKVRWEIGPGAPKPSAAEAQRLAEVIRSSVGVVQIPTRR